MISTECPPWFLSIPNNFKNTFFNFEQISKSIVTFKKEKLKYEKTKYVNLLPVQRELLGSTRMPAFLGRPNYTSDQLSLVKTIHPIASFWFDQKNLLHGWSGQQVERWHLWPLTVEFKKDHLFGEVHVFEKIFADLKNVHKMKNTMNWEKFHGFWRKKLKDLNKFIDFEKTP